MQNLPIRPRWLLQGSIFNSRILVDGRWVLIPLHMPHNHEQKQNAMCDPSKHILYYPVELPVSHLVRAHSTRARNRNKHNNTKKCDRCLSMHSDLNSCLARAIVSLHLGQGHSKALRRLRFYDSLTNLRNLSVFDSQLQICWVLGVSRSSHNPELRKRQWLARPNLTQIVCLNLNFPWKLNFHNTARNANANHQFVSMQENKAQNTQYTCKMQLREERNNNHGK
jgi:hypothetical protein